MKSLEEVRRNNSVLAWMGINFTRPVFRMLSGQLPYDIPTYTIYETDDRKRQKKFKKFLARNDDPFIVVVRDSNAKLEDVLFVPSTSTEVAKID